jgi:hypothetical protein
MQGLLNFRQSIQESSAFFAAAGDASISAVDVRDLADVAVAALTGSGHDNKVYSLTGLEALTFGEMARQLSRAVGRTITFVDVPPESMRSALADQGFPAWQADGLLEEFAMYRRGEAAEVEPGVREALDRPPRSRCPHGQNHRGIPRPAQPSASPTLGTAPSIGSDSVRLSARRRSANWNAPRPSGVTTRRPRA